MLAADDEEPETHRHPFSQEEHTHTHSAKTGTHASERGKEIHKGRHQASAVHLTWLPKFTEGTWACLREGTGCRAFGSSVVLRVRLCPNEISAPTQKDRDTPDLTLSSGGHCREPVAWKTSRKLPSGR